MPRQCTYDYKIKVIERFVRRDLLGYKPYERTLKLELHTRASCYLFCPFHTNYFYLHIQTHESSC